MARSHRLGSPRGPPALAYLSDETLEPAETADSSTASPGSSPAGGSKSMRAQASRPIFASIAATKRPTKIDAAEKHIIASRIQSQSDIVPPVSTSAEQS